MKIGSEQGLTLTELTVVIVLAGLVTVGLVTFYFNSQATWVDGSTQALAQRDATALIDVIAHSTHRAQSAEVLPSPDAQHQRLVLHFDDLNHCDFWWSDQDSLIHQSNAEAEDLGAVVNTKVARFELDRDDALVYVKVLEMRGANRQPVILSSSMALYNRLPVSP